MNPITLIFAVYYGVAVKTVVPCGNNVKNPNVSYVCAEIQSQSHFVEFIDQDKALRFVHNLRSSNRQDGNDPRIEEHKPFIYGMTVYTFMKIDGKWTQINKHEVD